MLSSIGRNGFIESLAARRHSQSAILLQRRLQHVSRLHMGAPTAWAARSSGALFVHRQLSTTPPGPTKSTDGAPQPPLPTPRKHKVELRPAPLKPVKSSTDALSAASKPPSPTPAASSSTLGSSGTSKQESLAEVTKHDLEDASQHGILAPPPADASWVGRLWHQGKELFKFYWRGMKLIVSNRRRIREIQERVKAGGAPLSRWETRFIRTNRQDTLKLVPFVLMIVVIEEIIPLVVLYAPFILPSTCLLPSQKERIDSKRREKQKYYALEYKPLFEQLSQRFLVQSDTPLKSLDGSALSAVNGLLALPTYGPSALRLSRLQQHLAFIADDDTLLARESFGQALTQIELRDALEERGIITDGLSPNAWRTRLEWWLTHVDAKASGDLDPISRRVLLVASSGAGKF